MTTIGFIERYQDRWDRRATVRSRPRRRPRGEAASGDYYPVMRQPLTIHPEVTALGEQARTFALVQSVYKYMNDVALTETEVVSAAAIGIANGRLGPGLSEEMRQIALTVVVDEAYHALVARDFIIAVQASTGIVPLPPPADTELSRALSATLAELPVALHNDFRLLAVCIAENTLTQEIVELSREGELATAFVEALADHLADEAQHAVYFQKVLAAAWAELDEARRRPLGQALPDFIGRYLNIEIQSAYDAAILRALGLSQSRIEPLLQEIHGGFVLGPSHPMVANILRLLERTGVQGHEPTRRALIAHSLLT